MLDREQVLAGLEEAIDVFAIDQSMTIVEQWVVRGALALLKAQEPRVLALDEIHRGMAVWLEDVDKADVILAIGGSSAGKAKCFITANDMAIAPKDAEYGIRWRAWTVTPTGEQRKAVKWE